MSNEFKGTQGEYEYGTFAAGLLVITQERGKYAPLATVGDSDLRFITEEDYANAQLFSAAPNLFKAVNDFLNHFEGDIPLWLFEEAEAAVAKSLGKIATSISN